ncbi:hypothetical protein DAETH_10340 [Deinococcus aetherius]|uniref:Uncharacterized protein n=1 Tax=Deinococcus aetherius TaxID=200252 RepID=A0ABN6RCG5_9DEIO|nr:hypothetical protein DAETH_10340 [Deinococcus aetherius]
MHCTAQYGQVVRTTRVEGSRLGKGALDMGAPWQETGDESRPNLQLVNKFVDDLHRNGALRG